MLVVREMAPGEFDEVMPGSSFIGSDGALHGWQCIELWTEQDLNAVGVYRVEPAPVPTDPKDVINGYHFEKRDGVFIQVLDVTVAPPPTNQELLAYASNRRWQKEIGGITSQAFGQLFTDRETRGIIGQTIQSIDLGIVQAPINFKTPSGFHSLDRASFVAISREIAGHVQASFDLEETVLSQIDAGTITTTAQIDATFAAG
jgi:hypothetical protein